MALWSVDRPPGLVTAMVTVRTCTLPEWTSVLPLTLVMVPDRVSKVLSRVTAALWPREKPAASSAGKGTFSSMVAESRMVATVWPAWISSPTSTSTDHT